MGLTDYEKNRIKDSEGKTKAQRWREANRDRQNEYAREWAKSNPDKVANLVGIKAAKSAALRVAATIIMKNTRVNCIRCGHEVVWPKRVCEQCKRVRTLERERERYGTEEYRAKCKRAKKKRRGMNDKITAEFMGWIYGCAWCGATGVKLEQDHVIPLCQGGAHHVSNTVFACRKCNASRGGKASKVLPRG